MTHGKTDINKGIAADFDMLNKEQGGLFALDDLKALAAAHYGASDEDVQKYIARQELLKKCRCVFVGVVCYVTTLDDVELNT